MKRINQILFHPEYQDCFREVQSLETDRKFCGHTMEHFLDVARLTYIFALEEGIKADREVIYAAALLHDIGRHLQYTQDIPHHEGSAKIAAKILPACGFTPAEQAVIIEAIHAHRRPQEKGSFSELLYRADKMSRNCFACPVQKECNWPHEKKNMKIKY